MATYKIRFLITLGTRNKDISSSLSHLLSQEVIQHLLYHILEMPNTVYIIVLAQPRSSVAQALYFYYQSNSLNLWTLWNTVFTARSLTLSKRKTKLVLCSRLYQAYRILNKRLIAISKWSKKDVVKVDVETLWRPSFKKLTKIIFSSDARYNARTSQCFII